MTVIYDGRLTVRDMGPDAPGERYEPVPCCRPMDLLITNGKVRTEGDGQRLTARFIGKSCEYWISYCPFCGARFEGILR